MIADECNRGYGVAAEIAATLAEEGLADCLVYIGQEATRSRCARPTTEDLAFTTWHNHGHLLARGADPGRVQERPGNS